MASEIDPTPLSPRPRFYTGPLANFLARTKKLWREFEFFSTDEDPDILYRGTQAGGGALGTALIPIGRVFRNLLNAVNVTGTATAKMIIDGVITSTSAAAVALTLPTGALLGAALRAKRGTSIEFVVDNNLGLNIVTVTASTGIIAATAVVTGGATLTVAAGAVGIFRIYFKTATTAVIYRIA